MKIITKVVCSLLACLFVASAFVGCDFKSAKAEDYSYVSLRINPEIELVVDGNGKVVTVNAINEDGETVLYNLELVGLTVEEASSLFTEKAIELGYIDVESEGATVYVFTQTAEGEELVETEEKIKEKINKLFEKKGVFGKACPEEMDKYIELAEELNVSVKEARIISRILELYPEKTVEEILALSHKEQIALIKENHKKKPLPVELNKEFCKAIEELKEEYAEFFELAKELKELEDKLLDETIEEAEKEVLQAEYDEKKARFEELKIAYEKAVEELKSQIEERTEETIEKIKEKMQERKSEFEEKIKRHEQEFEEKKEERIEKIKEWQKSHKK